VSLDAASQERKRSLKTQLALRGMSHNSTTLAAFVKTLALLAVFTGLAGAVAPPLLILVLRMNSNGFEADRKPSGKVTRTPQLNPRSIWLESGKGTLEPVFSCSGSEPSLQWRLLWIANQPEISLMGELRNG